MRLYVRDDRGAETYFEIDDTAVAPVRPDLPAPVERPGRAVGRLFRCVVEPFCPGTLYEDDSGMIWLDHVGCPERLEYVNASLDVLREACRRWSAVREGDRDYARFEAWLRSADGGLDRYGTEYPYPFWECEVHDTIDPFGLRGDNGD